MLPVTVPQQTRERSERRFTLGSFVLIKNKKQEVLLARRADNGIWTLPGGGIEHGESPSGAAIREVREETGLIISEPTLVGICAKPTDIIYLYRTDLYTGTLQTSAETTEFGWFAKHALPKQMNPAHIDRIHACFDTEEVIEIIQRPRSMEWLINHPDIWEDLVNQTMQSYT
jgi:8-oxo-dGTP pyrophosphatase MutT (NUDIX family)